MWGSDRLWFNRWESVIGVLPQFAEVSILCTTHTHSLLSFFHLFFARIDNGFPLPPSRSSRGTTTVSPTTLAQPETTASSLRRSRTSKTHYTTRGDGSSRTTLPRTRPASATCPSPTPARCSGTARPTGTFVPTAELPATSPLRRRQRCKLRQRQRVRRHRLGERYHRLRQHRRTGADIQRLQGSEDLEVPFFGRTGQVVVQINGKTGVGPAPIANICPPSGAVNFNPVVGST